MGTTLKISPERTKCQSLTFGRNLVVLAVLILVPGLPDATHGALTLRWPRAEAKIINANLRIFSGPSSDRRTRDEWHSFSVHYSYRVGDQDHYGGRVERYGFGMQNSAGADRMRERHPINSLTRVAYDPNDASVAYLEAGTSSFSLVLVGVGAAIGGSGLWIRSLAKRGIGQMDT